MTGHCCILAEVLAKHLVRPILAIFFIVTHKENWNARLVAACKIIRLALLVLYNKKNES